MIKYAPIVHLIRQYPVVCACTAIFAILGGLLFRAAWITRKFEEKESQFIQATFDKIRKQAQNASPKMTALITGANSGIGFHLAKRLTSMGVRVILGCRSASRGNDAIARIKKEVPDADVRLLIIDVSEPKSVLRAAKELRGDDGMESPLGKEKHLDYLLLNAGILPTAYYRWGVAIKAFIMGGMLHFLETSRRAPGALSFLAQPLDDVGAHGAPSMIATHVLGHLMLAQEVEKLMQPIPIAGGSPYNRIGRIVWTGSRSASAPIDWEYLQPPGFQNYFPAGTVSAEPSKQLWHEKENRPLSGFEKQLATGEAQENAKTLDTYSLAKYFQDLVAGGMSRRVSVPCNIICPGFVDTELTPAFFRLGNHFFGPFRAFVPGFNIQGDRGICAQLAVLAAEPHSLDSNKKWVLHGSTLIPAKNGFHPVPLSLQEAAWNVCAGWMDVWREKKPSLESVSSEVPAKYL